MAMYTKSLVLKAVRENWSGAIFARAAKKGKRG